MHIWEEAKTLEEANKLANVVIFIMMTYAN